MQPKGSGRVSNPRMPVDIVNFITLDDLMVRQAIAADILDKLLQLELSKVPGGYSSYTLNLTSDVTDFRIAIPWISFDIINDGPGLVKFSIEKIEGGLSNEADVRVNQVVNVDYHYPVITRLYLSTKIFRTKSSVRIYALEGSK